MVTIPIICTNCGFSRELPAEKVPERPVQVTCPRCKASFPFNRGAIAIPPSSVTSHQHVTDPAQQASSPMPSSSSPANRAQTGLRPTARGERQQTTIQPALAVQARRTSLQAVRLVILIVILLLTIGYTLREKIPLQKIRAATAPTRQVIVIPPPAGQPPALPAGNISVNITAGDAKPAGLAVPSSPTGVRLEPYDFPVFIYAVNLVGKIRVNGQEFREIKGDPDMQYNINTYGEPFRYGANSIELDLAPATGGNRSMNPELRMKVSRRDSRDERRVIKEWQFTGQSGWPRTVSLDIPEAGP